MPDPDESNHHSPEEPMPLDRTTDRQQADFSETRKSLDSFDVLPPVGVEQPEPTTSDGIVQIAIPEDFAD